MPRVIRVWIREDGEPPCVLQADKLPRGPGRAYDVTGARSRADAVAAVADFLQPEPDRRADRDAWNRWDVAQDSVSEVL